MRKRKYKSCGVSPSGFFLGCLVGAIVCAQIIPLELQPKPKSLLELLKDDLDAWIFKREESRMLKELSN